MDEQQDDASASNTAFQGSDSRRSAGSGSTALSDHGAPLPEDDLNGDEQTAPEGFLNTLLWIQDPSLSLRLSNPLAEAQHTLHERRAAEAMVQHTAMILDVDGLRHHMPTSTALPMNYEFPATMVVVSGDEEYDQATADLVNGFRDGIMTDRDANDYDDIPKYDDADAKSHNASEEEEDDVLYEERPQ